MGLNNSLNVSELLKRLGVKGDSLGSAPLLESLRLTLNIGDLSDLVPPVGVPIAGAEISATSGVGTFNKWSLEVRSPGGLKVTRLEVPAGDFDIFITDTIPFGARVNSVAHNFAFGQTASSLFGSYVVAAKVAPLFSFRFGGAFPSILARGFDNWVGPGQFFNIEATGSNANQSMRIMWTEYPAGLNP